MIEAGKAYRPAELVKALVDLPTTTTITFRGLTLAFASEPEKGLGAGTFTIEKLPEDLASDLDRFANAGPSSDELNAAIAPAMSGKPVVPEIVGDLFAGPSRQKGAYKIRNRGRMPTIRFDAAKIVFDRKEDGAATTIRDVASRLKIPQETARQALRFLERGGWIREVSVPGRIVHFTRTSKRIRFEDCQEANAS
ncbi:40S ribosomal protein S25 [Microvirga sp. Mcv34]|uniref:40S ribosomal protein S25 n=1 Tax=Microvirga sp. Mcv34 TaxID=2926016 RepID=UPI0021C961D1|nr:40S ribosomal protein S25 [Microvirga sp. Mcv34]